VGAAGRGVGAIKRVDRRCVGLATWWACNGERASAPITLNTDPDALQSRRMGMPME